MQYGDVERDDSELVLLAQSGDQAAFMELVGRHRSKAFRIAHTMTNDHHLAEDIVQEALLSAFLKLSSLENCDRFLPWLYRIIRNQTLMKMRGGFMQREINFTTYFSKAVDMNDTDWKYSENVLNTLLSAEPSADDDPLGRILRKEIYEDLSLMLQCLSNKERQVFEAHFLQQRQPKEIAELFDLSIDNVHKSLSRSRMKLRETQRKRLVQEYLAARAKNEPSKKMLSQLDQHEGWWESRNSFAACVQLIFRSNRIDEWDISSVMGYTSQAFRLNIEKGSVDPSSPFTYYWEPVFVQGLRNLGIECRYIGDGGLPPTPHMLNKGIEHIRETVQSGQPVIAWDLFSPGFGLIYGYDDFKQVLYAQDASRKGTIPYSDLGQGRAGGLFLLSLDVESVSNPDPSLIDALNQVVSHAYGERVFTGYISGLGAIDIWIELLRKAAIHPVGNAYTLLVTADARKHAVNFLTHVCANLSGEAKLVSVEAKKQFKQSSKCWNQLSALFPFPGGGDIYDAKVSDKAVKLLRQAKLHEEAGIDCLNRLQRKLRNMNRNSRRDFKWN